RLGKRRGQHQHEQKSPLQCEGGVVMNIDLNNLDLEDAPNWPIAVKIAAAVILFAAAVAGGWYLDWSNQSKQLERVATQETELKGVFENKQKRAVNLEAYQQQLADMEASFGAM